MPLIPRRWKQRRRNEPSQRVRQLQAQIPATESWTLPWPLLCVISAVVAAGAGWVLIAAICAIGWVSTPGVSFTAAMNLATKGWLLAHGIGVTLPGARLTVIPLGLSILIVVAVLGLTHLATTRSSSPDENAVGMRVAQMTGTFTAVYILMLAAALGWTESHGVDPAGVIRAIVIGAVCVGAGFAHAHGWWPRSVPSWLRWIGKAVSAGMIVMIAIGAIVLAIALVIGMDRICLIQRSLDPGAAGNVILLLGQLAWLPNFVLWSGAWASGAGIQMGIETFISPARADAGMLPAIPIFGALPSAGHTHPAMLIWLITPCIAGALSAWVLVKAILRTRQLGPDLGLLIGGGVGVLTGFVYAFAQWMAAGDLGSERLVNLGARMAATLVVPTVSMGLAGMLAGWIVVVTQMRTRHKAE